MTPHIARPLFVPTEGGTARYLGENRPPMVPHDDEPAWAWREHGETRSPHNLFASLFSGVSHSSRRSSRGDVS
jgi:hypothetical protein